MRITGCLVVAAFSVAASFFLPITPPSAPAYAAELPADPPGRALGRFKLTYYYVAEEKRRGDWPLYAPACSRVLSRTSQAFHRALSLEGTGRLLDGRLLNFAERCPCARPGHGGSRICYEVLDRGEYPWGKGASVADRTLPLRPFRSVAVDPAVVPLGTVLFLPAWAGWRAPNGALLDGCFRAVDIGRMVRRKHLDLFAGKASWARSMLAAHTVSGIEVYHGGERCREAFAG